MEQNQKQAITLNVVFGFIRSSNFPTEVLVIGFNLADVGPGAGRVLGVRDGRKLDFIQVLVPIWSHVPRSSEQSEEKEKVTVTLAALYKSHS